MSTRVSSEIFNLTISGIHLVPQTTEMEVPWLFFGSPTKRKLETVLSLSVYSFQNCQNILRG